MEVKKKRAQKGAADFPAVDREITSLQIYGQKKKKSYRIEANVNFFFLSAITYINSESRERLDVQ